jgi:hypothetical protein
VDKRLKQIEKEVQNIYSVTGKKIMSIVGTSDMTYDKLQSLFKAIFERMVKDLELVLHQNILAEWKRGDELGTQMIVNKLTGKISQEAIDKLWEYKNTSSAVEMIQQRMKHGFNLSERIWELANDYNRDLELLAGVKSGRSAVELATDLMKYLNDLDGTLKYMLKGWEGKQKPIWIENLLEAKGYSSSYKNALRLARTEINMAYRRGENAKYQSLNFVAGFTVNLSNRHIVYDICDELQGEYPVDFIYVGWHPNCLCFMTPILCTNYKEIERAILTGEAVRCANKITDVSANFKVWKKLNMDRINKMKNKPYFVLDNNKYFYEE